MGTSAAPARLSVVHIFWLDRDEAFRRKPAVVVAFCVCAWRGTVRRGVVPDYSAALWRAARLVDDDLSGNHAGRLDDGDQSTDRRAGRGLH